MSDYDFYDDLLDAELIRSAYKPCILIVDNNIANLKMAKSILSNDYEVITASGAAMMFNKLIENMQVPALILLDIEMPVMGGYETLKALKEKTSIYNHIPIILMASKYDAMEECKGLELGAVDFIYKPFHPVLLKKRLKMHMEATARQMSLDEQEVMESYMGNLSEIAFNEIAIASDLRDRILRVVADLLESRDAVTGGHIDRTQNGVYVMLDALIQSGYYSDEIQDWNFTEVARSSTLHDVGKIHVPDTILKKPGKLTIEEFSEMQAHTIHGAQIIEKMSEGFAEISYLKHAKAFAESHHEKWNGMGYPYKLSGTDIPLQGRILAFADVYDALVSERSYKKAFTHEEAVDIILAGKGTHFDPILSDIFKDAADQFKA
jgi:putative two-component system response regulator